GGERRHIVAPLRPLHTRVPFRAHLASGDRFRQPDLHRAGVYAKSPAGAYRVPVQLIVAVKEPELPRGAITNGVPVLGRHGEEVIVPRVDANAVLHSLSEPGFQPAVPLN